MAHLGEFGRALQDDAGEPDTFSFHGEPFVVPARASSLPIAKFAWQQKVSQQRERQAADRLDMAQARQQMARTQDEYDEATAAVAEAQAEQTQVGLDTLASIWEYLRAMIPDETEFDRLYSVALRVGADTDELFEVCAQIVQAVTARPTRRPSGSSGGPRSSGRGSTGSSASQGRTPGPAPQQSGPLSLTWEPPAEPVQRWAPPELSPAERQRAEFRNQMIPVGSVTRSGG